MKPTDASCIAGITLMHDGLLVEWASGLAVFYNDAFLWKQQHSAQVRRNAKERA